MSQIAHRSSHRDLHKFQKTVADARQDGKITKEERQAIQEARSELEPGEKRATDPRHADARELRKMVKEAAADGDVSASEKAEIAKAFAQLGPKEQKAMTQWLSQNNFPNLAAQFSGPT